MVGGPSNALAQSKPGTAAGQSVARLTPSQLRVLLHLARGGTYGTIAQALFVSPQTVRSHAAELQRRLRVPNNAALVVAAVVAGLLTTDTWPVELTGITQFDPSRFHR